MQELLILQMYIPLFVHWLNKTNKYIHAQKLVVKKKVFPNSIQIVQLMIRKCCKCDSPMI